MFIIKLDVLPYSQHRAGCMDYDARGISPPQTDIY